MISSVVSLTVLAVAAVAVVVFVGCILMSSSLVALCKYSD